MSNETLKELLTKLHETLETETVEADKLSELKKLDAEIQKLMASDSGTAETKGLLDQVRQVEAKFEMEHPETATFFGQLINTLSGMGI
jgi:CHASE3 domain sensor protein